MDKTVFFFLIEEITSSFERTDIENATKNFDKVVLITLSDVKLSHTPENLLIHQLSYKKYNSGSMIKSAVTYFPLFIQEFFGSLKYLANFNIFRYNLSSFLRAGFIAREISEIVKSYRGISQKKIYYSFWFGSMATALAILKRQGSDKKGVYISRAHGTDLYEERVPPIQRIAFRSFQLKYMDKVFSVSKKGTDYLKKKYPEFAGKVFTSYLGVLAPGMAQFNVNGKFTIVSCAKVRNIKRVHLIPEILLYLGFPLKWIHIGGISKGDHTLPLFEKNLERLKQSNPDIEVHMAGELSNEDVLKIYGDNSINLFLSVSETEGLPVSMMEAISCGIPILATDVGGCDEIVTEQTGILIKPEFDPAEVAHIISRFRDSGMNTEVFRERVKEFWRDNFNSEINFKRFIELVG
jgi:glycosyltransferase involved in cell wall biosynthesis